MDRWTDGQMDDWGRFFAQGVRTQAVETAERLWTARMFPNSWSFKKGGSLKEEITMTTARREFI